MSSIVLIPRMRRALRLSVSALGVVTAVTVGLGGPAGAASRSGDAVVVSSPGGTPIDGGNSATVFTLKLPDGAQCPGDSANDNYRIQSFLVPEGVDPATLHYRSIGPDGENQIALYGTDTNQLVQSFTQMNPSAGQPGVLPPIPPLTFAIYGSSDVTAGPHRMGIACTLSNTTTNYWDTPVDLTIETTGSPAQIRWSVSGAPSSSGSSSSTPLIVGGVLLVVGAGGVAYFLLRRRHVPSSSPVKEN